MSQRESLPDQRDIVFVDAFDERFRRRVRVSYRHDDPDRLMFSVDHAGGFVVSRTALTQISAALDEQSAKAEGS